VSGTSSSQIASPSIWAIASSLWKESRVTQFICPYTLLPFGSLLYQYSSDPADLSNCKDYQEFFDNYDFVIQGIHRLTLPGRMTAVHCADIIAGGMSDEPTIFDFGGDIIRAHVKCRKENCTAGPVERERGMCGHGWFKQCARYAIWKEPLLVRNRTMVKSLHHKTMTEDSTRCSMANADYLLVFRRTGKNTVPVAHPVGLLNYAGERPIPDNLLKWRGYKGNQIKNEYSHWIWRRYADAFWDDVRIDRVLPYRESKDEQDEKHVHPLQLDTIERAIILWSNPGEVVLTPFMGVGSEVWGAVMNGRKGIGVELKKSYYNQAVKNLESIKEEAPEKVIVKEQRDLFGTP
jgi:DNA methylase